MGLSKKLRWKVQAKDAPENEPHHENWSKILELLLCQGTQVYSGIDTIDLEHARNQFRSAEAIVLQNHYFLSFSHK